MIVVIDYGVGNLESIKNMLKRVGVESKISCNAKDFIAATKLILPGVGAFDTCAEKIRNSGLLPVIEDQVHRNKIPVLGVCVGMQLLLEGSEEGVLPGLGWIRGRNVKFKQEQMPKGCKIPHMGWADVEMVKPSGLLEGIVNPRFYFVHSYYAELTDPMDGFIRTNYGYNFIAGVEHQNILGVQFHPEKSHKFGMKLLDNFIKKY